MSIVTEASRTPTCILRIKSNGCARRIKRDKSQR